MTRRLILTTLTAMVLVAAVTAQIPQRDTRPTPAGATMPPAPTGTATLSGTVIADATGGPIGSATVVLIGTRTGVLKVTSTDRAGTFRFTALPGDRYTVGASKLPYLGAVAGARRPVRPGSPVVVVDGATVDDVTIRLPLGAALSGTISDEHGGPAPGANVAVYQRRMQNGERILVRAPTGIVATDERGHYRAFGLPPGEYLISAVGTQQPLPVRPLTDADVDAALAGGVVPPAPTSEATAVAPVYYPGTTRAPDALGVLVAAGDDRQNLDFRLERVRPARITGTVSTADGSPLPPRLSVTMIGAPGASPLSTAATSTTTPDGQFALPNQIPNTYQLVARAAGAQNPLTAVALVEVTGNADVVGVSLVLAPPLSVAGRVVASGVSDASGPSRAPSLAGQTLQFAPLLTSMTGIAAPRVTPTTSTGEFTVTGLIPGRYVLTGAPFFGASTDSVSWGLDTVVIDGVDVTDRAFDIRADALPKDFVVTFTNRWQDISGRVSNAEGAGISDYTMLTFPVDEAYWLYNSRRIVTAQPASDGRYQIGSPGPAILPAGEYYLAAVTDASKDEQYDPAFLQSLIPAAVRVTLAPGQRLTQDVRVR